MRDLLVLRNKQPKWNEQMQAFCLNFQGRVTEASVKNFQLVSQRYSPAPALTPPPSPAACRPSPSRGVLQVSDDDQDHVVLQFGKQARHRFSMDVQWPMSPLQAFGICLTSLDGKLGCE
jgi:tubby-related protein 1